MFTALFLPMALLLVLGLGRFFLLRLPGSDQLPPASRRLRRRLRWAGVAVLTGGLAASGWLLATDRADPMAGAVGYDYVGGQVFPVRAEESKRYQLEQREMGGMALLAVDELRLAFTRRYLGYTVGGMALAAALVCFGLARLALAGAAPEEWQGPLPEHGPGG